VAAGCMWVRQCKLSIVNRRTKYEEIETEFSNLPTSPMFFSSSSSRNQIYFVHLALTISRQGSVAA
jgi:hypothetical protein